MTNHFFLEFFFIYGLIYIPHDMEFVEVCLWIKNRCWSVGYGN